MTASHFAAMAPALLGIALAACAAAPAPPAATRPAPDAAPTADAPLATPVAADLIRAEWAKAENRKSCAPLAFGTDADVGATPRRANFSGGWAVAFDLAGRRSAYGLAGAGIGAMTAEALTAQWPYTLVPANLPAGSFAGYGIQGAAPYADDNPNGIDVKSLAYVRVAGQDCLYNVWSDLGRAHLEDLLGSLRVLAPAG